MKKKLRILALAMATLFVLSCLSVASAAVSPGSTVTLITTTNIYLPSSSASGTLTLTKSTKQLPAGTKVNVLSTSGGYAKIMVRDSSTSTPYAVYIPETSFTTSSSGSSSSIVGVGTVTGPTGTTGSSHCHRHCRRDHQLRERGQFPYRRGHRQYPAGHPA